MARYGFVFPCAKHGLSYHDCKECSAEARRQYDKKYRVQNATRLARQKQNRNCIDDFGISIEQKEEILASQDNKCGACGAERSSETGKRGWALDHSHKTGFFRGVLCNRCNLVLGSVKDSTDVLTSLVAYLNFKPDFDFQVL